MQGKTALITGSTSGIGLGMARCFAKAGANIILNGFGSEAEIQAVQKEIEALGVQVMFSGADMSKPEQIKQLCDDALAKFGAVDVLVNNAGIQHVAPIDEFPPEKWDAIIAINLSSAFHLSRLLIPAMKANKWGRIINVASVHGLVASPFKSAYISAKHGIVGMTKAVALEVAPFGITCNAICPGYVLTPLVEKQIPDQAKTHGISEQEVKEKIMLANHAIKDFVSVDDLAQSALFLCADSSKMITGIALPVDGGWSAH
jgi:3-hydroxybutyrate dehydrogenase